MLLGLVPQAWSRDGVETGVDVAALVEVSREPQFIGPATAQRAELERRAGDLDAARVAIDDGLDRIEFCSEDAARPASSVLATAGTVDAKAGLRTWF